MNVFSSCAVLKCDEFSDHDQVTDKTKNMYKIPVTNKNFFNSDKTNSSESVP